MFEIVGFTAIIYDIFLFAAIFKLKISKIFAQKEKKLPKRILENELFHKSSNEFSTYTLMFLFKRYRY